MSPSMLAAAWTSILPKLTPNESPTSSTSRISNSDQLRPFRQDRYFYYLTGCNEPGCYVTYDIDRDNLTLWLPPVDLSHAFYDRLGSTLEEAMEKYDVDEAKYIIGRKRQSNLRALVKKHHENGGQCAFLNVSNDLIGKRLKTAMRRQGKPALKRALNACRVIKDEHEINLVRKANELSAEAHTSILQNLSGLKTEAEVEAKYMETCLAGNAKQQSYGPICGAGTNAGQLHYLDNDQDFGKGQVLLVDAGAEWKCYSSDVTRTMPLNPKNPGHWPSKEAEQVYECVAKIQEECIKQMRPGKKFMHIAWQSIHMTLDALLGLRILKGEKMEIFHAGTMLAFYPYGLGHHMGLEVHEPGPAPEANKGKKSKDQRFPKIQRVYKAFANKNGSQYQSKVRSKDLKQFSIDPTQCLAPNTTSSPPLAPGMVVTIEPGIYFNKFVLDTFYLNDPVHSKVIDKEVLKRYMPVGGVRIEDDILITKDGCENLTTAPKGEEMLKIIREGRKDCENEKKDYENEKKDYENKKHGYENEKKAYETVRKDYENEKKDYENKKQAYENEKMAWQISYDSWSKAARAMHRESGVQSRE